MNIIISIPVIENSEKLYSFLNYFIYKLERHSLCLENSKYLMEKIKNKQNQKELYKSIIERQSTNIKYKKNIELVLEKKSGNQVTIEEIDNVLNKKPVIIVENKINDKNFIRAVLHATNERKILFKLDTLIEIDSMGGCGQIPQLIDEKIKNIENDQIFVLHDSDRLSPTSKLTKPITNIINKCKILNIETKMLKKREIENYIPDSFLFEKFKKNRDICEAWRKLSKKQKSHFDFKFGFTGKPHDAEEYIDLFKNLDYFTVELLRKGFGKDISSEAFLEENYFHYTGNNFLEDPDCFNDFKEISSKISKII